MMEKESIFEFDNLLNKNNIYSNKLQSDELFKIVYLSSDSEEMKEIVLKHSENILNRCSIDFDMFNYFTILYLKFNDINKDECNNCLDITVNSIFSKKTLLFLMKIYRKVIQYKIFDKESIYELIMEELKEKKSEDSSIILFDLYIFPDFKLMFNKKHRVISILIESYQLYDRNVMSSQLFLGSTIIGKLLNDDNEQKVEKYLRQCLQEKQISTKNIEMIGGGGSSLVYKIKNLVIKLGETRNNRRIYINHRILASLLRKLETNENGEPQFYVEIMKHIRTGDVTEDERDELKKDLYEMGLIWEDSKLENCGILDDDDENICELPVDYVEVMGKIENPYRREAFMKRIRKVVVLDNDHMSLNVKCSSS